MPWAKLDDQFPDHPKVVGLSHSAFRLHVTAMCYCMAKLTDGMVKSKAVGRIAWASDEPRADVAELVAAGLWDKADGGYMIHDFLEYNPTRQEVEEQRKLRAAAGQRGGLAKARANAKQVLEQTPSKILPHTHSPSPTHKSEDARADARAGEVSPTPPPPKPSPRRGRIADRPIPQASEAVKAYREIMNLYPSEVQQRAINERVAPEQVPRWREVVTAWNMQGNKKTNVGGMLDWFRDGVPKWDGGKGGNRRMSNVEMSLQNARELLAEGASDGNA